MKKFIHSKGFFSSRYFQNILPKFQNAYLEKCTFQWHLSEIYRYFLWDVTNKETEKVMWHRCWSPSIMNLGQLIFIWKGRHLVLALFASYKVKYQLHKVFPLVVTEIGKHCSSNPFLFRFLTCSKKYSQEMSNLKKYSLRLYFFNLGRKFC